MIWRGWTDFIHMGGQGTYVWAAVAIGAVVMAAELALIFLRERDDRARGLFDETREPR